MTFARNRHHCIENENNEYIYNNDLYVDAVS